MLAWLSKSSCHVASPNAEEVEARVEAEEVEAEVEAEGGVAAVRREKRVVKCSRRGHAAT